MGGEIGRIGRRLPFGGLIAAALVLLAATGPPTAAAGIVQDTSCTADIDQNLPGFELAQTITPQRSGRLVRVDVGILNATPYPQFHRFEIRTVASGVPTGTVLEVTSFSADYVNKLVPYPQGGFLSVPFDTPVVAGEPYALVYTTGGHTVLMTAKTACQGALFFKEVPSDPFTPTYPSPYKALFSTYVSTPTCDGRPPTIVGGPGDDDLRGTPNADVILGFGGEDEIDGLGGADAICAGSGDDTLTGGADADTLKGNTGDDALKGNKGRDRLLGHSGRDSHNGGAGRDRCHGGKGDDSSGKCETEKSV